MNVKGTLLVGLAFNGQVHREFTLNVLTVRGELDAVDALEQEAGMLLEDPPALSDDRIHVMETLAYFAQQLHFDGMPKTHLTLAFLLDNLARDDFDLLLTKQEELSSKLYGAGGVQDAMTNLSQSASQATEAPTKNTVMPQS